MPNVRIQKRFVVLDCALIDLDGTALQATDVLHLGATRDAFEPLGIEIPTHIYESVRGRDRKDGIIYLIKACAPAERQAALLADVEAIAETKNLRYRERSKDLGPSDVPDAVRAVLARFRELGVRLALATSSKNGLDSVNRVGLVHAFDVVVTGHEAPAALKYRQALDYLRLPAAAAVVADDGESGLAAARESGIDFTIGVGADSLQATVHVPTLGALSIEPA